MMFKALLVCAASLFVIAADFIPAPDLDAPRIYRKACIYCQNCTPICEEMDTMTVRWEVVRDSIGSWATFVYDTSYYENGFSGHCDRYRCQRTGKRMAFDSAGVIEWGVFTASKYIERFDTLSQREVDSLDDLGEGVLMNCVGADNHFGKCVPVFDMSFDSLFFIADTSGIVRVE